MGYAKVVLGIGNPGPRYQETRHNVGFKTVDALAKRADVRNWRSNFHGIVAEARFAQEDVLLVKPLTYVNQSGLCAREILHYYRLEAESLMVITDDVSLPVGRVRIRQSGSSGSHRGLQSIIDSIKTVDFPRLRIGVGGNGEEDLASYVLSQFPSEQREILLAVVETAADAVIYWIQEGIEACMNRYNGKEAVSLDSQASSPE